MATTSTKRKPLSTLPEISISSSMRRLTSAVAPTTSHSPNWRRLRRDERRSSRGRQISKRGAADRADCHNKQGRRAPSRQQDKANKRYCKIARRLHRSDPKRIIQRRTQKADDRCIDSAHCGLCARTFAEVVPEWQCTQQDEHAGKKNADQPEHRALHAV